MRSFAWLEKGQIREIWGDDPPWWMVEAVDRYRSMVEQVRFDVLEQDRKDRDPPPSAAPPGWVVEDGGRA